MHHPILWKKHLEKVPKRENIWSIKLSPCKYSVQQRYKDDCIFRLVDGNLTE